MAEEKEEWTYAGKPREYWKGYPTVGEIAAFEIWLERRERMKDRIAYIIIALIVSVIFAVAYILSANITVTANSGKINLDNCLRHGANIAR